MGAGQYNVSEAGFVPGLAQCAGFEGGQQIIGNIYACADFSEDCSGDISAGESLSCEIDNTVIDTSPTTATLTVNKEIYGCATPVGSERMDCGDFPNNSDQWINCNDASISGTSFCDALNEDSLDIAVLDNLNNPQTDPSPFKGSALGTTITNLQPGTYTVNEIKRIGFINQLGFDPFVEIFCGPVAGFTDGGAFQTLGIDYQICYEYEDQPGNAQGDDCRTITLAAGEHRTCTVKNYIRSAFVIPG